MTITAAKIKIKVRTDLAPGEADAGYSTIHVVEGIQSFPIVASDYGAHRTKTISGGSLPFSSVDGKQGQFVEIPLNATGISWITRGGNTKFCLRLKGDIIAAQPSGLNRIWWELDLDGVELIITEDGVETSYYRITAITGHAGVYQIGDWLTAHEASGTTKHFGATLYDSEGSWWAVTSKWNISRAFIGFDTTSLPPIIVPTVTTDSATDVEAISADINGTLVNDGGEACDCGFQWGETVAYGNTTPTQSKTTGQTFTQSLSGLDPNKTYHFRAFATNSAGTGYGADRTFVTLAIVLPTITTDPATDVEATSATENGTLDGDGGEACDCGFEWGLTAAYGNTTPTQSKTTGQSFSWGISGLSPSTLYHFRAFATNAAGTSYGADRTFTTGALPPAVIAPDVTTDPATGII